MAVDASTSTFGLPEPRPRSRFEHRSGSVAADLDHIFRAAAPPPAEPAPPRAQIFLGTSAPARAARVSAATLGLLAAALLAGISIGSILTKPPPPPKAPTPVVAQAPVAPQPVAPAPVAPPATLPPVAAVTPAAPVETAKPRPVKAAAPAKTASARASGCQALSGAARARCAYPAVLAADKRLRQAYARATRAGVSRSTLISYRNRWASLRRRSDDQPSRVIAGYGSMASELNRLAAKARRS